MNSYLIVLRFHCTFHRLRTPCSRCNKAAPEQNQACCMFHSKFSVIYIFVCVCFISGSMNTELMGLIAKKLQFCLICSKNICPEALGLLNLHFGQLPLDFSMILSLTTVSPLVVFFGSSWAQTAIGWCNLTLMYLALRVQVIP